MIVAANFTGQQVNFPDIPELRSDSDKDALIFAIVVNDINTVPAAPSGNPLSTIAQLVNGFLTLYVLGTEEIFKVPLSRFLLTRANGAADLSNYEMFETRPLRVDWTKSYVSFALPPAPVASFSFLFEFAYDWFPPNTYAKYLQNENTVRNNGVIKGY